MKSRLVADQSSSFWGGRTRPAESTKFGDFLDGDAFLSLPMQFFLDSRTKLLTHRHSTKPNRDLHWKVQIVFGYPGTDGSMVALALRKFASNFSFFSFLGAPSVPTVAVLSALSFFSFFSCPAVDVRA